MKNDIFEVDQKIWDIWSKKKFSKNNILVLGFNNPRAVNISDTRYKDVSGIEIDSNKGKVEIYKNGNTISISIDKNPDKVIIERDGKDISILIL